MEGYKIHILEGYIQSIYIAEYSNKLLMLDGGSRGDVKHIESFITKDLKRSMNDLKLIVVSHLHPDHAGAAPLLRKKYNIPIASHPELDYWYSGISGFTQHLLDTAFAWYVAYKGKNKYKRVWYQRSIKPDFNLKDNQPIPFFDDWKAIYTIGHTTHDISIYNETRRTIYIGDLAVIINNKYNLPFPIAIPDEISKSLDKVSALDINEILFAHGGIVKTNNPQEIFNTVKSRLKNYPPKKFNKMKWFTNLNKSIRDTTNR